MCVLWGCACVCRAVHVRPPMLAIVPGHAPNSKAGVAPGQVRAHGVEAP